MKLLKMQTFINKKQWNKLNVKFIFKQNYRFKIIYTYIYVYIYTHTHTHTHIHIDIQGVMSKLSPFEMINFTNGLFFISGFFNCAGN